MRSMFMGIRMTELELQKKLAKWELFRGFTEAEIRGFHAGGFGRLSEYQRGDMICGRSGQKMPVTCILFGAVGIYRLGNAGEILLEDRVCEGSYLGLDSIGKPLTDELHHYYAETEVLLYQINPICFANEDYLGKKLYTKFLTNINRILSHTLFHTNRDREYLLAGSIRTKLLLYLEEQRELAGKNEFHIPYTRDELAEHLHTNRTALSREIGRMMREDLIETRGKYFLLKY